MFFQPGILTLGVGKLETGIVLLTQTTHHLRFLPAWTPVRHAGPYVEDLDEIVEIMVETVCAKRKFTRVAGSDFPHEVVKSRLLKLNCDHVRFVMDCMRQNTTKIRNIKQYLLAALFNAPTTMSNYYTSLVNHDMYGG